LPYFSGVSVQPHQSFAKFPKNIEKIAEIGISETAGFERRQIEKVSPFDQ
jgi:hypothetical protein